MDEAARFLRYVIPGLLSVAVSFLLLGILEPAALRWWLEKINSLGGISIGVGAITVAVSLGFVYANSYFALACLFDILNHDHLSLFRGSHLSFQVLDFNEQPFTVSSRLQSWVLLSQYWTSNIEKPSGKDLRGTDPFAGRLTHHMHANSTAAIGVFVAILYCYGLGVNADYGDSGLYSHSGRLIICMLIWAALLVVLVASHVRTKKSLESVVHSVIMDRLSRASQAGTRVSLYYDFRRGVPRTPKNHAVSHFKTTGS